MVGDLSHVVRIRCARGDAACSQRVYRRSGVGPVPAAHFVQLRHAVHHHEIRQNRPAGTKVKTNRNCLQSRIVWNCKQSFSPAYDLSLANVGQIGTHFRSMNRHTARGCDAQSHTASFGVDDLHSNAVTYDDFFASFSSQYKHDESSLNRLESQHCVSDVRRV